MLAAATPGAGGAVRCGGTTGLAMTFGPPTWLAGLRGPPMLLCAFAIPAANSKPMAVPMHFVAKAALSFGLINCALMDR